MSKLILLSQRDRARLSDSGSLEIVRDVVPQPHHETNSLNHAEGGVVVCKGRVWRVGKLQTEIRPRFGRVGETLYIAEPFQVDFSKREIIFEDGARLPVDDDDWLKKMKARERTPFPPFLLPEWACRQRAKLLSCKLQKQSKKWKWVGYARRV